MDSLEKTYLKIKIVLLSLVGIVFFIFVVSNWDSIVELNLAGVGSIKMEARQDLDAIKAIRRQVEKDSKRIEEVARKAGQALKIIESIKEENIVVKKQIHTLVVLQNEAQNTIKKLNDTMQFARTFISAYSDDRESYDQLVAWSNDMKYSFHDEAGKASLSILEKHSQPFYSGGFTILWDKKIDPSKLTIKQIESEYSDATGLLKPALLEFIWQNKRFSQYDKMEFMIAIMKKDSSLRAVEYAGRYFTQGAGFKPQPNPLAVEFMEDWWNKNKEKIRRK